MSTIKGNLKFVMNNNRGAKLASKNIGSTNHTPDFSSTINITTNSKVKDKLGTRKGSISKVSEKLEVNSLVPNSLSIQTASSNTNAYNNFQIISNLGKKLEEKLEKKEKMESSFNLRDLRSLNKEKMKENYNSNNSNRSFKNIIKEEKIKPKHQKHSSEVPQAFKGGNINHITDNFIYHQTTSNNILEIYTQTTNKERENLEKSNMDPSVVKIKSSNLKFNNSNLVRSSRGASKHSQKESSVTKQKDMTSLLDDMNSNDNINYHPYTHSANNLQMPLKRDEFEIKYKSLLGKYKESDKTLKELMRTIDIMKNYIKANESVNEKAKIEISEKINKKNLEIKLLKVKI
jgi:hypothetical protein